MIPIIAICEIGLAVAAAKMVTHIIRSFDGMLQKKYAGDKVTDQNVLLILRAKEDHNRALDFFPSSQTYSMFNDKTVRTIYKTVETTDEFIEAIRSVKSRNNRITGLYICAHGTPRSMVLGKHEKLSAVEQMRRIVTQQTLHSIAPSINMLEKKAVIVLSSCSTRKTEPGKMECIAQSIANIAKGRFVVAPSEDITSLGTTVKINNSCLDTKFRAAKKSSYDGIIGKIINIWYHFLFVITWGHYGNDCTCKFQAKNAPPNRDDLQVKIRALSNKLVPSLRMLL